MPRRRAANRLRASALAPVACAAAVACLLVPSAARGAPPAGTAPALAPPGPAAPAALQPVFPSAARFEAVDLILDDATARRLDELARTRIPERLVTFYVARGAAPAEPVLGYAVVQSHVVRTKRETLLVAFEPDGRIRRITVLAFLEPPEYRPPDRWLAQFPGKGPADRLAVGDDLAPITGSTLSARGVADQSRWLLQALLAARAKGKLP